MAVKADLDALRQQVGAKGNQDDGLLSDALDAARAAWRPWIKPALWDSSNVQMGLLMSANRLYRRRNSATGVEGFGPEGSVVRVLMSDPDIAALMGPARDMLTAGVA